MERIKKFSVLRLLGLVAIIPMLIGHGGGDPSCLLLDQNCPETAPLQNYNHVLSGSADPSTNINIGGTLSVTLEGSSYTSPASSQNGSIPPIVLSNHSLYPQLLDVVANDFITGGGIGEMWIHSNLENIKLIHPTALNSHINAIFEVRQFYFGMPQSAINASSGSYSLSSGSTGSEPFLMNTAAAIYLNNVSIFTHGDADAPDVQPILFSAMPGDVLRIVIGGTQASSSITSIWLHTPTGAGIKLSHVASNLVNKSDVFLDLSYILPQ